MCMYGHIFNHNAFYNPNYRNSVLEHVQYNVYYTIDQQRYGCFKSQVERCLTVNTSPARDQHM